MEISLSGKQILITGGTSALGEAFVRRARAAGAEILFTFNSDSEKAHELESLGAKSFQLDLANREQVKAFAKEIKLKYASLDGLIHNAAITRDKTIHNLEESWWDEALEVDLSSIYLLTKELLKLFLKNERSKILMVVSQVGLHGGFGQAPYAAAKGGLIALTKSLAKELGKRKILVNALNPGYMESKMTKVLPPDITERNLDRSVIHEISKPNEVADFMIYLMSDRVSSVSGQIFHYESRPV